MDNPTADISQIRKYLNGELDAKAMHRLERQALDDPFLAEAIAGYQNAGPNQGANLNELSARLGQRTKKEGARVIPLIRYLAAAASVLIVFSAGIWWYSSKNDKRAAPVTNQVALNTQIQTAKADTTKASQPSAGKSTELVVQAPRRAAKKIKANRQPAAPVQAVAATSASLAEITSQPPAQDVLKKVPAVNTSSVNQYGNLASKDTTPLNEMIVMGYTSSRKTRDTTTSLKKIRTFKSLPVKADSVPQQRLAAQVPGVKVYSDIKSQADLDNAMEEGQLGALQPNQLHAGQSILGKVVDLGNGAPVKGALVHVIGSTQVARTDARGYFKLNTDTAKGNLVVTNKGYKAKQISGNLQDSAKTIALQPDSGANLGEDIATGFTSQAKSTNDAYYFAQPVKGWSSYRAYLKTNAVSPDGATGVVRVSFMVDKYGTISDIKIVKGLTDAANKKAINLVNDGPDWTGNSNRKPEKVTLRIKFSK